ncbi:conditioned medium-induced protein 4 [Halobacteriales archaeon QS_4_69_225]|nr:MAG: conditioned medium-induced protein 4 [Halobacteriales archaeon QS_4_69_225]
MTENTDELRDIFRRVADEDTVTETQEESRGSLTDEGASRERLIEIIERMRADHEFETELSDAELATVVRRFYDDDGDDDDIAEALDVSPREAFRARMDLHLVRETDTDPFDLAALRDHLADGESTAEIADRLDVDGSAVRRYRRVVEAEREARRVSERFRIEFEDAVPGAEAGERFTEEMTEDGLDEATEDIETDVSF